MLDTTGHPTDSMSVPIALLPGKSQCIQSTSEWEKEPRQLRKCWPAVRVRYKYSLVMAEGLGGLRLTGDTVLSHASLLKNSWEVTTEQITYYSPGKTLKQSLSFKSWWPRRVQHGLGCCTAGGPRWHVTKSPMAISHLHVQGRILSRVQCTLLESCQ